MGLPQRIDLNESSSSFSFSSPDEKKDFGKADTLRYNILNHVVSSQYDRAILELKSFLGKDSEFPQFRDKIERYIFHAVDLVNAIKTKRSFMGGSILLTMAKQQELHDKYKEHFAELHRVLSKIEKIQRDLRVEDVRSTVLVVKALSNSVFVIVSVAFAMEVMRGLLSTLGLVLDDLYLSFLEKFFNFIGW